MSISSNQVLKDLAEIGELLFLKKNQNDKSKKMETKISSGK